MDVSAIAPVLRLAGEVRDPRRHNIVHPLPQMIVMAVVAVLCDCDGWDQIVDFCRCRVELLGQLMPLPRGVPSQRTFARVFGRLDPQELDGLLRRWMTALGFKSAGQTIAIDGKSMKRSFAHAWDVSGMAHLVSAYAGENKVVLSQIGVDSKENEIVVIPKLLALLDLTGSTVTIDAIGCQREIARQITGANGDYVLALKDNQPTLHDKAKALLDEAILEGVAALKQRNGSHFAQTNAGHGRIEVRRTWLLRDVEHLGKDLLSLWPSIRAIAVVDRKREVTGRSTSRERAYYILSDGDCDAERAAGIIRGHWAIENSVHHVLDVTFHEDDSRVRKDHSAENFSRLRRLTSNLLRQSPTKRTSIRRERKQCARSPEYALETLLRGFKPEEGA